MWTDGRDAFAYQDPPQAFHHLRQRSSPSFTIPEAGPRPLYGALPTPRTEEPPLHVPCVHDLRIDDEHGVLSMDASLGACGDMMVQMPAVAVLLRHPEDGHVVGAITVRELVAATTQRADAVLEPASHHMTTDLLTVPSDTPLHHVVRVMRSAAPAAVVVTDERGRYAGFLSPSDYKQAVSLVRTFEQQAVDRALNRYETVENLWATEREELLATLTESELASGDAHDNESRAGYAEVEAGFARRLATEATRPAEPADVVASAPANVAAPQHEPEVHVRPIAPGDGWA